MRRDEFNTDTRTVTTYDESGEVVSTRPYAGTWGPFLPSVWDVVGPVA